MWKNFLSQPLQLSKCLKSEAIGGGGGGGGEGDDLNLKKEINKTVHVLSFTEWQPVFVLMIEIIFIYLLERRTNSDKKSQEFHLRTCIQLRVLKHPPENS